MRDDADAASRCGGGPRRAAAIDRPSRPPWLLRHAAALLAAVVLALLAVLPRAVLAADLTLAVASSLTPVAGELAEAFEASERGTTVHLSVGSSAALLQQLVLGARADVFVSADDATLDDAEGRGLLIPGSRTRLETDVLTVVVARAASEMPATLADLVQAPFRRIAVGAPAVAEARGAFDQAGLRAALEPKLVTLPSVRDALEQVSGRKADAAFARASDAASMADALRVAFVVPAGAAPARHGLALVAGGPSPVTAQRFLAFLATPKARAVLARHGLDTP